MKLGQIMTAGVWSVTPEDTIGQAAERLRDLDIGLLAVVSGGEPVGVVTDRDITVRAVAAGLAPSTAVGEIMSAPVVSCRIDQRPGDAARLMGAHQVRRLLVRDRSGRVVGVLSLGDLALTLGNADLSTEILQEVCKAPLRQ